VLHRSVVFNITGDSYRMRTTALAPPNSAHANGHHPDVEEATTADWTNLQPNPHPTHQVVDFDDREWWISPIAAAAVTLQPLLRDCVSRARSRGARSRAPATSLAALLRVGPIDDWTPYAQHALAGPSSRRRCGAVAFDAHRNIAGRVLEG